MLKPASGWLLILLIPVCIWSLASLESRQLYQPDMAEFSQNPLAAVTDPAFVKRLQEITLQTADGCRLNAWYLPPPAKGLTVLFAHGNGGNLGERWRMMRDWSAQGYGMLAFDYRGFGKSTCLPTEEGLYQDMESASQYLARRRQTPFSQQILWGESLGSAVAVEQATRRPYRAMLLMPAMSSTPAVAAYLMPKLQWMPWGWIMRQHFDALGRIERISVPLLIIHGQQDEMMPVTMPQALYARTASNRKRLLLIPDAHHNDVYEKAKPRLFDALHSLLTAHH